MHYISLASGYDYIKKFSSKTNDCGQVPIKLYFTKTGGGLIWSEGQSCWFITLVKHASFYSKYLGS